MIPIVTDASSIVKVIAFRPNGLPGKRLKRKGAAELYCYENQLVTIGLALGMEAEMVHHSA